VLIVARGGGSLEDLQAFNDEIVARAIHDCVIPVVSGVGHEIDFTIADFVADRRAPTPSAAAELVSPDQTEFMQSLIALDNRLRHLLGRHLQQQRQTLQWLLARLQPQHPGLRLRQQAQRLDELEQRMRLARSATRQSLRAHLAGLVARLDRQSPLSRLALSAAMLDHLKQRLCAAGRSIIQTQRHRFTELSRALHGVSPLATLDRGYAIVTRHATDEVIHNAGDLSPGDTINARLARGRLICTVEDIET
jgi:exodeoxyribonuclease VII large subunit